MKTHYYFILAILLSACAEEQQEIIAEKPMAPVSQRIVNEEIQEVMDSVGLKGSVLIYNPQEDTYYSNYFQWCEEGKLPASTFKIANSIIALECNVVEDDSTLFKWNGEKRRMEIWEQDLIFRDAFHLSCVPCYQEIARKIGVKRMTAYLNKLNYGNMIVDSTDIDLFWLVGESKINQFEQIDFLKRFYNAELPIAERTTSIMKRLMVIEENESYKISGKTGWAIRDGKDIGWFVGYIETNNKLYYFATKVEPTGNFDINTLPRVRKEVTFKAFEILDIIPVSSVIK